MVLVEVVETVIVTVRVGVDTVVVLRIIPQQEHAELYRDALPHVEA